MNFDFNFQDIFNYAMSICFTTLTSMVVVEWSPIKINPIRWLGKRFNSDMNEQMKQQFECTNARIAVLEKNMNTNEIDRIRKEISDFADSLRRNDQHSKDQFFRIVNIHEKYNELLKNNKMTNGVIDTEYRYIDEVYQECLKNGTLL